MLAVLRPLQVEQVIKMSGNDDDLLLADVLLLCVTCKEPIKARINTNNWIRVEFISPQGECLKCYQEKKRKTDA